MANYLSDYTGEQIDAHIKIIGDVSSSAASHNGLYRGINLLTKYTIEQIYEKVHAGDFSDLYLGDYIPVSISTDLYTTFTGPAFVVGTTYYERTGSYPDWVYAETSDTTYDSGKTYYTMQTVDEDVDLMIAHFNYFKGSYHSGTDFTNDHLVLIPKLHFITSGRMNPTDTTEGGYYNSEMHQILLPCYLKSLSAALNNHLLTYYSRISTAIDPTFLSMGGAGKLGAASAWSYYNTKIRLMNEVQVYGTTVYSSSYYDVGVENKQLAVFKYVNSVPDGTVIWLSSVHTLDRFAIVNGSLSAQSSAPSYDARIKPFILFG